MKPLAAVVLLFVAVLGVLAWSFSGSGGAPAPTPREADAGAPADFIILDLGELAKNLGGGVVDSAGSENSGTVIGNLDARQGIGL